jgi:type IV secretion system protein VirD4
MSDSDYWDALMTAMIRNLAAAGVIKGEAQQLNRRKEQAAEEFSAIVSTMKQDTNFLDDPVMREALSAGDADFSALKGTRNGKPVNGAILSVVIPLQYLRSHAAYARLAIAVALWEMQRAPVAKERVLFVLDEFPALGRMDRIAKGLAELRKYKVWLWPIIQDLSQLKSLYDKSWSTFVSNASVKQWFGTGDLETAEYVSKNCGDATVFAKTGNGLLNPIRRQLVTPEEVQHLPLKRQIVMAGNLRPMNIRLTPYWERPEFAGRFHPNPFAGSAPSLPATTALRFAWGKLVRIAAMILEPAPVLLYAAAIAALIALRPAIIEAEYADQTRQRIVCDYRGPLGLERRFVDRPAGIPPFCPPAKIRENYWVWKIL